MSYAASTHDNDRKGATKSRRILLVDDWRETLAMVRHLVGVAVPEARLAVYDANKGIPQDLSKLQALDLILLALHSTGEPRFDWVEALCAAPNSPPVVVLTDIEDADLERHALELGAADHICRREMTVGVFAERIQTIWAGRRPAADDGTALLELHQTGSDSSKRRVVARARKVNPSRSRVPAVPGYTELTEVGQGGMATVYLAQRQDVEGDPVILKILPVGDEGSEVVLRRFLREFRIAARLEHPNIVRIYERAFASDFAYIAMEYCGGGDLSQKILDGVDAETAIDYTRKIASALGAAHREGVVHRDVKPANVLFRDNGSLVLTDFGIAKAKEAAVSLTRTNSMVGTPHYISPEQIRGAEIDPRADLYSLGVMFFEMMTGQRPFRADRLVKLLDAHLHAPVPKLPEASHALQPVMDKLMVKDPDERFQNAQELIDALQ